MVTKRTYPRDHQQSLGTEHGRHLRNTLRALPLIACCPRATTLLPSNTRNYICLVLNFMGKESHPLDYFEVESSVPIFVRFIHSGAYCVSTCSPLVVSSALPHRYSVKLLLLRNNVPVWAGKNNSVGILVLKTIFWYVTARHMSF